MPGNRNRRSAPNASAGGCQKQLREGDDTNRRLLAQARRRRLVEHLHRLGPAPLGYFLRELGHDEDVDRLLTRYSRVDAEFVRALGGDRFPPLLRCVGEG